MTRREPDGRTDDWLDGPVIFNIGPVIRRALEECSDRIEAKTYVAENVPQGDRVVAVKIIDTLWDRIDIVVELHVKSIMSLGSRDERRAALEALDKSIGQRVKERVEALWVKR